MCWESFWAEKSPPPCSPPRAPVLFGGVHKGQSLREDAAWTAESWPGELLSLQRTLCALSHSDSEMLTCLHCKDVRHLSPNILRPVEAGPLFVTLIDVLFIQGLSFLSSSDLD